jgi:hypothetical protein
LAGQIRNVTYNTGVKSIKILDSCVACSSKDLFQTLNLGEQPLANNYSDEIKSQETYPLCLNTCKACFHSQLSVAVSPSLLFSNYLYVSGTSITLKNYFLDLKDFILNRYGSKGKLLDVGSNDGTFLRVFEDSNWNSFGVDPAINLVSEASKKGVLSIASFFDLRLTEFLAKDFDIIVAMNVLAHTSNPLDMLLAMKSILHDNGSLLIQTSQANMIDGYQFDTIYHEHISFFNVKSMTRLLARAGLFLQDVQITDIHGGSYLWIIGKQAKQEEKLPRETHEEDLGLFNVSTYSNFATTCSDIKESFRSSVSKYRKLGFQIAVYGSAAKGNTFLNYSNIEVDYIFDDTPQKIGKYSPVQNRLVRNPEELRTLDAPCLFIIPAWNFRNEILNKLRVLRTNSRGDMYLLYYPQFEIDSL